MDQINTAGGMFKMINETLEKDANNTLRPFGITASQITVLMLIKNSPCEQLTFKEIEHLLHCAQPTVHGLVNRLEEKNMVFSFTDENDKRVRSVKLSEKGKSCLEDAEKHMVETDKKILSSLNKKEQKQFLEYLSRVMNAIIQDS